MTMADFMEVVDEQLKSGEFAKDSEVKRSKSSQASDCRHEALRTQLEAISAEIRSYIIRRKKAPLELRQKYDSLQSQLDELM